MEPQRIQVKSPEDVIVTVPHILGFEPESSLVIIPVGVPGPSARVDLGSVGEVAGRLVETYAECAPPAVVLVSYGDAEVGRAALEFMRSELVERGNIDVPIAVNVEGDSWDDIVRGTSGTVSESARLLRASEGALLGRRQPLRNRAALVESLQERPDAEVGSLMPAAVERVTALDVAGRRAEVRWFERRLDQFIEDGLEVSAGDTARLLAFSMDAAAQDAVAVRASVDSYSMPDLWSTMLQRSPLQTREGAATLLAMSAWMHGNGALALAALDEASTASSAIQSPEPNRLAGTVKLMIEHTVNPQQLQREVRLGSSRSAIANMQAAVAGRAMGLPPTPPPPEGPGQGPDLAGPSR